MKSFLITITAAVVLLSINACKQKIQPAQLYGEWKYIKIDHLKGDDMADTISAADLRANAPYIKFKVNNQLEIWWGGKILSHGTFRTDGSNIQFTEQLPDGKTRTFPFWVSNLDTKNIIFETTGSEASRVSAVKQ